MKVAIIGAGYVGLITALGLARLGRQCVCVEKNPARLSALRRGEVFFHACPNCSRRSAAPTASP